MKETGKDGKDEGKLYVGMDLGTSRTAVAASNGVREFVATAIGYPKDVVAEKLLQGRKAVFGEEAISKRTSLRFYQPLAHGVIKSDGLDKEAAAENLAAAKDIVRHALELARPRKGELTYAVIGAPAVASQKNKRLIVDAVKDLVDSVLICSEPFSVAYGVDKLDETLVIDIGAGTTDLCRMHGTLPEAEDQITLTFAGDYVDQQLHDRMKKSCPEASFNLFMVKEIKERHATIDPPAEPIVVTLPVKGRQKEFEITKDVQAACLSIVKPMVDAMVDLIGSFEPDLQHKLRNNVLVGGGGSQIRGLDRALERAMADLGGGRVMLTQEPLYAGCNGALKIAQDMPDHLWEKLT